MHDVGPLILKILACCAFGTATALFVLAAHRMMQVEGLEGLVYAGTSMRRAEVRRRALEKSPVLRAVYPFLRLMAAPVDRLQLSTLRDYVRGPYARAGYPGGLEDDEVVAIGFVLGVFFTFFLGFSAVVLIGVGAAWIGFLGLPIGFLAVVSNLKSQAKVRQTQVMQALPYVLDLLVLILKSGTSLGIALGRVVEDYAEHPIGVELGQVLAEINMGSPRVEAMKRFAERLEIPDVTLLSDSITQSEELGWPLAETLERLSDRMMAERVLQAQATAGSAGVLVMLPSTLVLAAAVLMLFGPIIVRFLRGGLVLK